MQNFTTESLLQYLYGELDETQANEIETELLINWALHEKFQVLKECQRRLDRASLVSPRQEAVASILRYARKPVPVVM